MANVVSCWRRPRVRQCLVRVKPWRQFDRSHCRVFLQALHFGVNRWKGYFWEERNAQSCRGVLFDFLYMYNSYVLQRGISDFFIEPFAHTRWKQQLFCCMSWAEFTNTLALTWYRLFKSIFLCFRRLWFLGFFWSFCYCFGLPVLVNAPHYHENDMITNEQFGVGAECSTDEPVIHIQLLFYFGFVPSIHKLFIALCISCLELFLTAV